MSSQQEPLLPVVAPAAEEEQAEQQRRRRARTLTPPGLSLVTDAATGAAKYTAQQFKRLKMRFGQVAAPAQSPTRKLPHSTRATRIADIVDYYASKLNPLRPPVEQDPPAADPNDTALKNIVSMIADDFATASLPVDRHQIRTILTTEIQNPADFVTVHDELAGKSWRMPEDRMRAIFGAVDASAETYTVPAVTQAFYVRARELHLSDVALLHERFARKFHQPQFLAKLEGMIASAQAENTERVFLRYIGTVRGPSTPRDRYEADIASSASLFGKIDFILAQMQADEQLISPDSWAVAEFVRSRTDVLTSEDFRVDFIERVLISLFGYEGLINVQRGGYFAAYEPTTDDLELFRSLDVSIVSDMHYEDRKKGTNPIPGREIVRDDDADLDIANHFQNKVFEYIRENPSLVCHRQVGPTTRIVLDTIRQAIPRMDEVFRWHADTFGWQGRELEDYDPDITTARFLHGNSRAGHLTRILLSALRDRDPSTAQGEHSLADFLDLLPFVDLYPWLIQERVVSAMEFLSQYMSIVRLYITVTFSKHFFRVISRGFAPFGNLSGAPVSENFLDSVGVPRVSNFDMKWIYDDTSDAAPDSAYTVQIPHYDPGRDKYGEQAPVLRRVLLLTWMATFVTIQETYAILLDLGSKVANLQTPRKDTCERIVAAVTDRLRNNGFTEIFEAAKAELQTYLAHTAGAVARRTLTEEAKTRRRAKMAITRASTLQLILARGAPNSDERRAQAELLWSKKFEPLGQHMPYNDNPENREAWLDWVMERNEGVSLVTAAIGRRVFDATVQQRRIMLDSLALDDDSAGTEDALMAGVAERLEAMRVGRAASAAFQDAQRNRMLIRWNQDPDAVRETARGSLQSSEVTILEKYARFYAYVQNELKLFRLALSPTQLASARDHRALLKFDNDGIRLEDEDANDLGAFYPVSRMPLMKGQGKDLQTVWHDQRRLVAPNEVVVIPPTPAGRLPPKWAARDRNKSYLKVAPIDEADAIYIFKLWLDERLGEQQNLVYHHWQWPDNVFLEFPDWITANLPNHVHAKTWQDIVENGSTDKSSTAMFRGSIEALRGPITITGTFWINDLKLTGSKWAFGGPRPDSDLAARATG
ncbi:hypothetical protein HDU87_001220 [Geranomyces variabilis]|uniref:Uncharacterized protein n=1 Tax=Geranomyces variabilis TaxID=109894 RepID=A0AAD5TCY4_9FUNG|nr:hypothetical protein HDU87_001220 [Geranomyces variabilis]